MRDTIQSCRNLHENLTVYQQRARSFQHRRWCRRGWKIVAVGLDAQPLASLVPAQAACSQRMIQDGSISSNFRNQLILTLTFKHQVFTFKIKLLDIKTTCNLFQPNTYLVATTCNKSTARTPPVCKIELRKRAWFRRNRCERNAFGFVWIAT